MMSAVNKVNLQGINNGASKARWKSLGSTEEAGFEEQSKGTV